MFLRHYVDEARPGLLGSLGAEAASALIDELAAVVNRFAPAANFFWGVWAIVQARHSPIDFDFMNYAALRLGGYYKQKAQYLEAE